MNGIELLLSAWMMSKGGKERKKCVEKEKTNKKGNGVSRIN